MRRAIVAFVLAVAISGCGLISSDVTETPFDLPTKMYSFDTSSFPVPAGVTAEIPCGAGQLVVDCCMPPAGLPMPDCNATPLTCEQNENGTAVCTATVPVTQKQMLNFGQEVPELQSFTGILKIKVKRISYLVMTNTLTVDLPDVDLYLGPASAMKWDDPGVVKFGTLPAIQAGTTPGGDVQLVDGAEGILQRFTEDITQPISFIASTMLRVTRTPTGRIDLLVSGKLAASL
jgi:hypothetical protein